MSGTSRGARISARKNQARDPNYYRKIGRKGGRSSNTGGFAANPELARMAGIKSGQSRKRLSRIRHHRQIQVEFQ